MDTEYISDMLFSLVTENEEMHDLIGTRMYPLALPKGTSFAEDSKDLPAIHYGGISDLTFDEIPRNNSQWQLTVTAGNYREMRKVCATLRRCLHRYKGGSIKYIGYVDSMELWDNDTRVPYTPMTFKVFVLSAQ